MLKLSHTASAPERLLRRYEYERMMELGIFDEGRVELLRGVVVAVSPRGPRHEETVSRLNEQLVSGLGRRVRVRVQSALALSEYSLPTPDVAIVPRADYSAARPTGALLIVEVADASLGQDRGIKARLYAEAAVGEYWIVNLLDGVVEVYRQALGGRYIEVSHHPPGAAIVPSAFSDLVVPVSEVL